MLLSPSLSLSVDNDNLCALSHGCSHICLFNSSAVCQCPDGFQFQSDSDEICTGLLLLPSLTFSYLLLPSLTFSWLLSLSHFPVTVTC